MAIYSPKASGLGNSAAYQVAGKPYVTGSLIEGEASGKFLTTKEYKVTFPTVTKRVQIFNYCTSSDIAVHFESKSTSPSLWTGFQYGIIRHSSGSIDVEVKCTELYITAGAVGAADSITLGNPSPFDSPGVNFGAFGVMAELTGIPSSEMYELTGSGINVSTYSDGQH